MTGPSARPRSSVGKSASVGRLHGTPTDLNAVAQFMATHYSRSYASSVISTLIDGISPDTDGIGPVARRERLGGLLNFYYREAA